LGSGDDSTAPALVVGSRVSYESIFDATRGSRKAQRVQRAEAAELPENRAMDEEQAGDGGIGTMFFFGEIIMFNRNITINFLLASLECWIFQISVQCLQFSNHI